MQCGAEFRGGWSGNQIALAIVLVVVCVCAGCFGTCLCNFDNQEREVLNGGRISHDDSPKPKPKPSKTSPKNPSSKKPANSGQKHKPDTD